MWPIGTELCLLAALPVQLFTDAGSIIISCQSANTFEILKRFCPLVRKYHSITLTFVMLLIVLCLLQLQKRCKNSSTTSHWSCWMSSVNSSQIYFVPFGVRTAAQ